MEKRNSDMSLLEGIMNRLVNEEPLPPEARPHGLSGDWAGATDCHIKGDWVLIYEIDSATKKITFERTGTHTDLFKK
jgi:mRNA interferase YafQ